MPKSSLYEQVVIAVQWLQTNVDQGWSHWEDIRDDFDLYEHPLTAGYII